MMPPRVHRLRAELAEVGVEVDGDSEWGSLLLTELDYALRPRLHERRIPSVGAILEPTTPLESWEEATRLQVTLRPVESMPLNGARLFADGVSSWLIRRADGTDEWAVFDRPAGSERDLVVLSEAMGATVVQRHPNGIVRVIGPFGVLRWDAMRWQHEPPVSEWIDAVAATAAHREREVLETLLEFAVHDLGSRGIGALLVYRPDGNPPGDFQLRLPEPPALDVVVPADLAPLRHALAQTDGAAVLDADGILRQLGVRLVPSPTAEAEVASLRGMRHTSARRYSFDDPTATVIVVSEDGPVTVLRGGEVIGTSPPRGGMFEPTITME
jgi:hypothetical protein